MTPRQAARELENIGKRFERAAIGAVNASAREGRMIARQTSSGRHNARRRQRSGHSYSRRRPNPPADPGIINVETGRFRSAWQTDGAKMYASGEVGGLIYNNSDRARYLTAAGSRNMMGRPAEALVKARLFPVFQFEVERAIARVRM